MPLLPHDLPHHAKQSLFHRTAPGAHGQGPEWQDRSLDRGWTLQGLLLALTVPMSPGAFTPVLPGLGLLGDMKMTYPLSSYLDSNQSKESLFLSSALKTYNSKGGRL